MLGKVFQVFGKVFRGDAEKLGVSIQGFHTVVEKD